MADAKKKRIKDRVLSTIPYYGLGFAVQLVPPGQSQGQVNLLLLCLEISKKWELHIC